MGSVNRERRTALVREADALRNVWLLAREEHRVAQLDANVEIRRVSIECGPTSYRQSRLERLAKRVVESGLTHS